MWSIATGNSALEGLGRLQTGVAKRSINEYFLLKDGNPNHPADFVKNKVHDTSRRLVCGCVLPSHLLWTPV